MEFEEVKECSLVRTVSPEEYLTTPRPQLEWLISGLIPKPGYMLLLGPPKVGKSFLAFDIAKRIAKGEPVMGYSCPAPKRVLYLQMDTKEAAWTERLRKMKDIGYDLNVPNLRLVHQDDMLLPLLVTTQKGQDFLRSVIKTEAPDLVILDVLRELHQEDENDSTGMKKVFDAMEPIFTRQSVIILHHTRKVSADDKSTPDPVALARGSSYITGRVDGYWLLVGEAPLRKLYFESRFQESSVATAKQGAGGVFSFPELERDATLKPLLLKLCADNPTERHDTLREKAFKQWGITGAHYYRLMQTVTCVHQPK